MTVPQNGNITPDFNPFSEIGQSDLSAFFFDIAKTAYDELDDKGYVAARMFLICEQRQWPLPGWVSGWLRRGIVEIDRHADSPKGAKGWLPSAFEIGGKPGRKKMGHSVAAYRRAEIAVAFAEAIVVNGIKITDAFDTIGGKFGIDRKAVENHVYEFFKERPKGDTLEDVVWRSVVLDFMAAIGPGPEEVREARRQKFHAALASRGVER